ncbi:MAG: glycosyltransferase family 2 protein [Syntrophaceae bacterium]|nr:glycosyltransferase family 2 protein [Syntrophaceae bacterium]
MIASLILPDKKMLPSVFIIVLNWNGKHHMKECLDSLSSLDYPNFKVVLVDNGSKDGSLDFVKSHYPDTHLIQNEKNLGFAEGNNVGIRFALSQGADYVVLLNNDTRVESNFLTYLIQRGEENKAIGVLGGKVLMYFDPRIINSTGVNLNQFAYGWDRDFGEEVLHVNRERGEVLAVTGCLMAIKRAVFEKIGLFDPKYFAYYEDMDFCIRVWKETPLRVEYVPEAVIYHKFSASISAESNLKKSLMLKNQYRLFCKHFPLTKMIEIFPFLLLHHLRVLLDHLKRQDFYLFFLKLPIILKYTVLFPLIFFFRIPNSLNKRCDEQRFWKKVIPEMKFPSIKAFLPRYEQIVLKNDDLKTKNTPHRILMGVNDEVLGEGWSRLISDFPRIRRMSQKAVCFLRNEKRFEYLQIHGLWDSNSHKPWLELAIEGQTVGRRKIERGWHTYIFPFENRFKEGTVEVSLLINPSGNESPIEKGFAINEIGLFHLGSPLLRWIEG